MYVSPWSGEGLFDASPAMIYSYKILTSFQLTLIIQKLFRSLHLYIFRFSLLRYLLSLTPNPKPSLHVLTSSFPSRHVSQ